MSASRLTRRARLRRRTQPRRTGIKRTWRRRPGLDQARKFARGRADEWCEANTPACPPGRHKGDSAHHRRMRSQGGSDDPGNLLWCCTAAHVFIHANPRESYERGWLIRSSVDAPRSVP